MTKYKMKIDIREVRVCSVCGKPMLHGYTMYDTEYACSDECLLKSYGGDRRAMEEDFADHGEEGDTECFWTCWPSMFFTEDELTIEDLKYMWAQLNDIPVNVNNNGDMVITSDFAVTDGYSLTEWKPGTGVVEIFDWFDKKCTNGYVEDLMMS